MSLNFTMIRASGLVKVILVFIFSVYDINQLAREALSRWLKPPEVYFILQNYEEHQLTHQVPQRPTSNFPFLFCSILFLEFFFYRVRRVLTVSLLVVLCRNRRIFVSFQQTSSKIFPQRWS